MAEGDRRKQQGGEQESASRVPAIAPTHNSMADAASQRMRQMGRSVGNEEIQARLSQGSACRDEMLAFIHTRLETIREVQLREVELMSYGNMRKYWRRISDSHKDIDKPEPTRWIRSGALYEEAMTQLCRGAIGRGAELLQHAIEAEKKAFGSCTKLVELKDIETDAEAPEAAREVTPEQGSGSCDVPPDDKMLAHEIQACAYEIRDPPNKGRVRDPWWTWEEEEDEDEGDGSPKA